MSVIKNRAGFKVHAAPEAIRDAIRRAERRMNEARHEYQWLTALLQERLAQIEDGEWPPASGEDR